MKTILSSRRRHYMAIAGTFLTLAALVTGMAGCGSSAPAIEIQDWYGLNATRDSLANNYILMNDLDSTTAGYEELAGPNANEGKGWEPVGRRVYGRMPFTGTFDGQGYEIRDLFINRADEGWDVGLFGAVSKLAKTGTIKNVGAVNFTVIGGEHRTGGLVGILTLGVVSNCYCTGDITGDSTVGGLVGYSQGGPVSDSSFTGSVTGGSSAGGLLGYNGVEAGQTGTVSNCWAIGTVTGDNYVGGLVGGNGGGGTVSDSYSTCSVTGIEEVGGLIAYNYGVVSNCYCTGSVTGIEEVGGLVGDNEGTVSNCYATGSVTGEDGVFGLVGHNRGGTVSNSYSTGHVIGNRWVGGLVGFSYDGGTVSNSHYNYGEVLINGENIITIGALFGEDFDQWLANGKFLDVNERFSQENGYYLVNDVADFKELLAFGQDDSSKFRLKNDLDLATEPNFYIPYFAGEFDGNGHEISNLSLSFDVISRVGLFGQLAPSGKITDLGVDNVNITGVGSLAGLVGFNDGNVSNSYSTGNVTGDGCVGGLVGLNWDGTVSNSYSTGNVTGYESVGGLVGFNCYGSVSNSYSTSSVTGYEDVGGLVGWNYRNVSNSYSTGSVAGDEDVGGLVGHNSHTVGNSFWDTETSGQATSDGGTGKTTAEMQDIATYTDTETEGLDEPWDITTVANPGTRDALYIWNIVDDETYPFLSWQPVV